MHRRAKSYEQGTLHEAEYEVANGCVIRSHGGGARTLLSWRLSLALTLGLFFFFFCFLGVHPQENKVKNRSLTPWGSLRLSTQPISPNLLTASPGSCYADYHKQSPGKNPSNSGGSRLCWAENPPVIEKRE